jgi:hypothetical protein
LRFDWTRRSKARSPVRAQKAPHEGSGPSVWYRLRVKRDVMVDISACGKFEPSIIVYRGRSLGSLRQLRYSDSVCRSGFGIAFKARRGRSYAIEVLDEFPTPGLRGSFRLRVASIPTPPNDDFVDALPLRLGSTVGGTTAGGTGEPGEPRRCCGVLHTVWYQLRVATPGHVRLSACNPRLYDGTTVAVYTGDRVSGLTRAAYYGTCFVGFAAQPGVTYRVVADDQGHWGRFRLSARTTTPPPNDNFADATAITLGTPVSATTRDATPEAGEPPNGGAFTVWFRLAIAENTPIELTVANNEPETLLAPCEWRTPDIRVFRGDQLSQLEYIAANEGCFLQTNTLQARFNALPGIYSIWVAGTSGEGNFTLRAAAVSAPP